MVMNILSNLLNNAAAKGIFNFHPKCKKIDLAHLIFADDLLVFCKGNLESVMRVITVLDYFYEISGLKLNVAKCEIFIAGISSYLTLLLILLVLSLENYQSYISGDTSDHKESFGQRLPASLRQDQCQTPSMVQEEAKLRWQIGVDQNSSEVLAVGARVRWGKICTPKSEGGLGLKDIKSWNKSCMLLLIKKLLAGEELKLDPKENHETPSSCSTSYCIRSCDYQTDLGRGSTEKWLLQFGIETNDMCILCSKARESRNHLFAESVTAFIRKRKFLFEFVSSVVFSLTVEQTLNGVAETRLKSDPTRICDGLDSHQFKSIGIVHLHVRSQICLGNKDGFYELHSPQHLPIKNPKLFTSISMNQRQESINLSSPLSTPTFWFSYAEIILSKPFQFSKTGMIHKTCHPSMGCTLWPSEPRRTVSLSSSMAEREKVKDMERYSSKSKRLFKAMLSLRKSKMDVTVYRYLDEN
ncbi:hypothetical protein F3Y22_tig00113721pilonHSYRG00100 [Hibiscus syriacus]|uniref:Uncharacterized protein n=1 Tax=Hibiscus syriacus TaxID=106335 RepID=A0A6A2WNI9_HIBSY|nr:hypothetical protein F3Y22_tig00113721pilonHSYRG00100 [Hibiscus syriacus]